MVSKGGVEEEDRQLVSSSPLFKSLIFFESPFLHLFFVPGKKTVGRNLKKRTKKKDRREKKIEKKRRCLFRVWDFFSLSFFGLFSLGGRHIQKSSSLVTVLETL